MSCCVIFDCDGTLVDSEPLANGAFADLLRENGVAMTGAEAIARFRGMKLATCLAEVESQTGVALPADFVAKLRARTADAFRSALKPIPGALDLVRSMAVPFGVASSGPREKIELSLSLTGLLPFFGGRIFSSYEIGSWKPDPGIFLHAADRLGAAPGDCIVVEDSLLGIEAGIAAGMRVLAFQPEQVDERIPPAATVVRSMEALGTLLATYGAIRSA
jgi:HAD superfamily hydrolase (TIGR01509 family)